MLQTSLSSLIAAVKPLQVAGSTSKVITDVICDSRKAQQGVLFVAVRGVAVDAHKFIPQVIAAGATAIVCEALPAELDPSVTYVQVPDSTIALALLASEWFGRPSEQLKLVGVTGTNGKTTIASLLHRLAQLLGYKAGLLSTVKNIIDTTEIPAVQTTPDPLSLNKMLYDMVQAGCDYAFMEVSSHSVVQHRIDGLVFSGAVFTNLTRDHLDFHKTVDNYIRAKKGFFDMLPADAFALANADDKQGPVMMQNTKASKHLYSLRSLAEFQAKIVESRLSGTTLNINGCELEVLFTGRFNAYNLLAVYGAAILIGWDVEEVLVKMSLLVPVAGRFQTFTSPRGYTAIVDYAHTPDALVNVLSSISDVMAGKGQNITVVGCGGNRDKGKRPIMAQEAARRSHKLILTSDNPRFEEPDDILNDMVAGLDDDQLAHAFRIADRKEAIRLACQIATPGDVILVAGKGHEDYQEIRGVKHHFDDSEVLAEIFKSEKR